LKKAFVRYSHRENPLTLMWLNQGVEITYTPSEHPVSVVYRDSSGKMNSITAKNFVMLDDRDGLMIAQTG
jgi:hypothetical protein